jgi:hypothetical protein
MQCERYGLFSGVPETTHFAAHSRRLSSLRMKVFQDFQRPGFLPWNLF